MSASIPCSVQVLTRNSAGSLAACLEGLRDFREVIVLDGGSTDGTRAVAAGFPNVTVADQDVAFLDADNRIADFGAVRSAGLALATQPWFLYVDADEILTPELIASIRAATASAEADAYEVFRRFVVQGEKIMRSAVYPATHVRLARRSAIESFIKTIHERFRLKSGTRIGRLDGDLLIPLPPARELRPKYRRYLALERRRAAVLSPAQWLRWILWWNARSFLSYALRLLVVWMTPGTARLPLSYEVQFLAYPLLLIVQTVPFPRGKPGTM